MNSNCEMCDNFKGTYARIIGIPEWSGKPEMSEKIIAEIFQSILKAENPQIHESQ